MTDTLSEKTFDPTPHRRRQASQQGHVARSRDLIAAAILTSGIAALLNFGQSVYGFLADLARHQLGQRSLPSTDLEGYIQQWNYTVAMGATALLPALGCIFLVAVATCMVQVGFRLLPERALPKADRIDPSQGCVRLFSFCSLSRILSNLAKVTVIFAVLAWYFWSDLNEILILGRREMPLLAAGIANHLALSTLWMSGGLLVLGLVDYGVQRWRFESSLRMSARELKEEISSNQANAQVVARRRWLRQQMTGDRLRKLICTADVIVSDSKSRALALRYDPRQTVLPIVLAKGMELDGRRIFEAGREADVPIVRHDQLCLAVYDETESGQTVDARHLAAVANVLRQALKPA